MKRFSVFLCICLLFSALTVTTALAGEVSSTAISLDLAAGSVTVYESGGVTYCTQNGETQATTGGVIVGQTDNGTATANTVKVTGGSCRITISSVNIEAKSEPVIVDKATLELHLLGSSMVKNTNYGAGIRVKGSASLVIGGSGSIAATGGSYGAGIGGASYDSVGTITINGGTVTAKGGSFGAGIGGGHSGRGGTVTINGGTVIADSGSDGAGIGGGMDASGGHTTINGGTVTANGYGAGIGGGDGGDGGYITITGGTVTATGKYGSAGIGGGGDGDGGSITISGGSVTAVGEASGAGIGGGSGGNGGTVVITDGTVKASSGNYGAGIGGGMESTGGSVTITGGTIKATGGRQYGSVDVGAGYGGTFDAVTISEEVTVIDIYGDTVDVRETIFIDKQPLTAAAHMGNTPTSFLSARAHSGLSYQWQISVNNKTWTDLEGEIAAETTVFSMTEEWNGAYLRCKLINGWGNVVYTDAVQICVLAFAQQPVSIDAHINDMVVFETLSTCPNVTYQWQRSYDEGTTWAEVPGGEVYMMAVNVTLAESAAKYRCVITATNGDQLASEVVSVNLDLGDLVTYTVQDFWQNTVGDGYTMKSQQVFEGLSGETVTASEDGYDGFTLNTRKSTLSGTVAEDSSLVLTRYFDRNTYSITFDTNGGGALPELKALYGASITAPGAPARYGQVFDGWYTDEGFIEEYIFDTMPLGGATVYAKWAPVGADRGIEYTINGLAIRDSNTFEPLDEIPEDNFLVEVSITNLEATETDTILLVYYTDEGQMLGMNYMFANTAVEQTVTFGASVNNADGEVGRISAFVLPSLGNPTPLARSAEIR